VTPAPPELYLAIALLLKNNLIVLGDVLPYVSLFIAVYAFTKCYHF
jgi:hypothetical protein